MTEEIKILLDILNKVKNYDDKRYFISCGENDYLLTNDEIKVLLNYITNLQKENEELKDTIKKDNHLLGCNFSKKDKYKQERDIYKQRNEKAVEFVKSMEYCGQEDYFYDLKSKDPCGNDNTFNDSKYNLLNILESGDE